MKKIENLKETQYHVMMRNRKKKQEKIKTPNDQEK